MHVFQLSGDSILALCFFSELLDSSNLISLANEYILLGLLSDRLEWALKTTGAKHTHEVSETDRGETKDKLLSSCNLTQTQICTLPRNQVTTQGKSMIDCNHHPRL